MIKKLTFLFFLAAGFISCEKALIKPDAENTPVNNFELLWKTVDEKYSFFTFKNIDWDSVYQVYRPQVHNRMSDQELFDVLDSMLFQLKDGHVNLYSPFDFAYNWEWFQQYYHNFSDSILEINYLQPNGRFRSGPLVGAIIDSVGYIYYKSFLDELKEEDIDEVIGRFKNLKGVIVDVRDNDGGELRYAMRLASRFADRERVVAYWSYKKGPAHDDFYSLQPRHVAPEGKIQFTKPVMVLTNRLTFSSGNDFVLAMKQFPHVKQIGNQTGGGGGLPHDAELLNGWTYRFSSTITLAPDGFNVEHGIPPDINIDFTKKDVDNGVDPIIERALREI